MTLEGAALALRLVVPFDAADVEHLAAWWSAEEASLGVTVRVERVAEPAGSDLTPDTLLLGYERGLLEEIAADGALGSPIYSFGFESWTPVWAVGGAATGAERDGSGPELPEIDAFERLLDPALRGHVYLRNVTFETSEGLILGDLARRLDRIGEVELPTLVIASYEGGTILGAHSSIDRLLRSLPAGGATIAPVRAAVRARRAGVHVSFTLPREGFLALALAAAATKGTSPALCDWLAQRFERDVAPRIARELELEPEGELAEGAPEWLQLVAKSRQPIERAAAGALRVRLARLYGAAAPTSALPESGWFENLIDTFLLTAVIVAALFLWRRERRSGKGA